MDAVSQSKTFRLGKWLVEPSLNRISCAAEIVRLEPQNMKSLLRLAAEPGAVVSLEELESDVWRGLVVTPNSVYQSVAQLRRALGDDKARPVYIQTVPRRGYRLVAPVSRETDPPVEAASAPPPPIDSTPAEHCTRGSRPRFLPMSSLALAMILGVAVPSLTIHHYSGRQRDATAGIAANPVAPAGSGEESAARSVDPAVPTPGSRTARARVLIELGDDALRHGHREQARRNFEQALELQTQVSGRHDPNAAIILARLANVDFWSSRYAGAEAKAREAVRIFEQTAPELHPSAPRAHDVLANVLTGIGQYAEAGIHAERSLELARALYGEFHIRTIDAESSLAVVRLAQERVDEAEAWARRALQHLIRAGRGEDFEGAYQHSFLAEILYKKGRYAAALTESTKALELLAKIAPPDHPYIATAQHIRGESLIKLGKCDEAEEALMAELRFLKDGGMQQWRIARATSALGDALLGQGRIQAAEAHLVRASADLDGSKGWIENNARLATEERMQRLRRIKAAILVSEAAPP